MLGQYKKKKSKTKQQPNLRQFLWLPPGLSSPLCLKEFHGSQSEHPSGDGLCLACDSILEVLTGLQQTLSFELSSLQTISLNPVCPKQAGNHSKECLAY